MRAITIEPQGVLAIREQRDPDAGVGEVLVRIRAAGVNMADLGQRAGVYPAPFGSPPDIPGLEFAGEVVSVGSFARRFSVGDRVMGVVGGGAQADLLAVHERQLMLVPDALSWEQAGGFPEAFVTAHDALLTQGALRPGERVLITGAAGGVGTAGVQLAAAAGAEVIASVRNPDNREAVRRLGAIKAIDPAVTEANGPYDVVLELVGASNFESNLRSLNQGGRIVLIGASSSSGTEAKLDFMLLAGKRATVRGSTLRSRPLEEKALATRGVEREVIPLLHAGKSLYQLQRRIRSRRLPSPMTHSASLANSARSFCSRESFRKGHAMPQTDNLQIHSRNRRTSSTRFVPPTFQLPAREDE